MAPNHESGAGPMGLEMVSGVGVGEMGKGRS